MNFISLIYQLSWFDSALNTVHLVFFLAKIVIAFFGSVIIIIGAFVALYRYLFYSFGFGKKINLRIIQLEMASTILLSLEFFVASDAIETIIAPDFRSVSIFAIIVIIRTLISYTLQREVTMLSQKAIG